MRRAAVLLALALLPACSGDGDPIPSALRRALGGGTSPPALREALRRGLRDPDVAGLRAFYERRQGRPAWTDAGGVRPETDRLLEALARADREGLDSEDYGVADLQARREKLRPGLIGRTPPDELADLDLRLTAAFLRYASDVSTGRLHPDEVSRDWTTEPERFDPVGALERALSGGSLEEVLRSLPPPHPGYARLRETLARLEAAPDWPAVASGDVAALRARLGLSPGGGLDREARAAIAQAQEWHGIEPDGEPGEATLEALNVPRSDRLEQLRLNLERWRWIPRDLGPRYVLVNIPGFDLRLVEDGREAMRMKVVAGRAATPTPVLADRVVAVAANPPWTVPTSIAVGEYAPRLARDARVLQAEHIRVFDGPGDGAREIDPASVDWGAVEQGAFPYVLRQDPGPWNALGRIKFVLTNRRSIYLHDTPAGALFGRAERGFSHGCVRVEHPAALATRLLGPGGEARLAEALGSPETRSLPLPDPVPIHLLYWTAWVEEDGGLRYGPDIYGFDEAQEAALRDGATREAPVKSGRTSGTLRRS